MSRTDERSVSAPRQDAAQGRAQADRPPGERADHPRAWSHEDLRQRLERLPRGHPSSPYNADGTRKPPPPNLRALELPLPDEESADDAPARPATASADGPADPESGLPSPDRTPHDQREAAPPRREHLSDAEHAEHVRYVQERLDWARREGLATDRQYLVDAKRGLWSDERSRLHYEILGDLYAKAAKVPSEHRAIMAGGLGGAGKSTVLKEHAGIDRSQYLTINPDDIKEVMAARGLIPEVDGLSPMEASDLVHEESSYLAKRLARQAMEDGKNVIWDITMSSRPSTERRLDDLDKASYATTGIFVDIPVEVSVRRADARHRGGYEDYLNGSGMGGRYVPAQVIRSQADPQWGSVNRRTFEEVKDRLSAWALYDNSVSGRDPVLVASGGKTQDLRRDE